VKNSGISQQGADMLGRGRDEERESFLNASMGTNTDWWVYNADQTTSRAINMAGTGAPGVRTVTWHKSVPTGIMTLNQASVTGNSTMFNRRCTTLYSA
jgi:hypothetical protein